MLEYDIAVISIILAALSLFYYCINSYMALSYKDKTKNKEKVNPKDVTILVPVYKEDKETFTKCIKAITKQNAKFIVVGDGCEEPYRSITLKNGGKFIFLKKNVGQRRAHTAGIKQITTKYVLFVDSDTIIPENTLKSMLSKFGEGVGGMGTRISIKLEDNWVSYSAEFFQRAKELVFKAMAFNGPIFVIGGRCCLYRVDAIKPFMQSDEFLENKIFGKKCLIAEDMHITSHILKSGYKAVTDYDVNVVTDSQKDFKLLFKQMVRWARGGYLYFFKDIADGTYIKKGAMYSFEMFYIYLLPTALIITAALRLRLWINYGLLSIFSTGLSGLSNIIFLKPTALGSLAYLPALALALNVVGVAIFMIVLSHTMSKKKLKTIASGALASVIMFCASMYALLTVWEQEAWLTK